MQTRTWPYGTRKQVRVLANEPLRARCRLLTCVELADDREGYLILCGPANVAAAEAKSDDLAEIVFTDGGPTGGFWLYEPTKEGA